MTYPDTGHRGRRRGLLLLIVALTLALRLIQIGAPTVGHHSWRQADTAAISRNFVEEQFDIRYPRIDWRGATSGLVECEFPIYPFLMAGSQRLLGIHDSLGRAWSILFSLIALACLYSLSDRVAGQTVALWATFFFAVNPMTAFFGRAVMAESMLLAASGAAVLGFFAWGRTGR